MLRKLTVLSLILALLLVTAWPLTADACTSWVLTEIGWACADAGAATPSQTPSTSPVPGYPTPAPGEYWIMLHARPGALDAAVFTDPYLCQQMVQVFVAAAIREQPDLRVSPCQHVVIPRWLPR